MDFNDDGILKRIGIYHGEKDMVDSEVAGEVCQSVSRESWRVRCREFYGANAGKLLGSSEIFEEDGSGKIFVSVKSLLKLT